MSTASFPEEEGGISPVAESELVRFRDWLVERGYAAATAKLWTSHVRSTIARGVDPEAAVDLHLVQNSRCTQRTAWRAYTIFREGGG